jgi:hypothetical protein
MGDLLTRLTQMGICIKEAKHLSHTYTRIPNKKALLQLHSIPRRQLSRMLWPTVRTIPNIGTTCILIFRRRILFVGIIVIRRIHTSSGPACRRLRHLVLLLRPPDPEYDPTDDGNDKET